MSVNENDANLNSQEADSEAKKYWDGIESTQKAEDEAHKKERRVTDPRIQRRIRINGAIMSVLALLLLIPSLAYISGASARISTYTNKISPADQFPDLYKLDVDSSPLLAVIAIYALIGLISGIARLKRGQRGPGWLPMTLFASFFILLVAAFHITKEIKEPIIDSLHVSQHEWAEERYGITYDEITVGQHGNHKYITYFQDEIVKDGMVIGRVCEREDDTIVFCGVNSIREMPVLVK